MFSSPRAWASDSPQRTTFSRYVDTIRAPRKVSLMDPELRKRLVPGAKVKVTQQIAARHYALPAVVEGTVVSYGQKQTGSWFAHSRDDKLWLDRLVIRKDDGETTSLILDAFSHIEVEPVATTAAAEPKKNESELPV
jgi:hypothetical protein